MTNDGVVLPVVCRLGSGWKEEGGLQVEVICPGSHFDGRRLRRSLC